MSAYFTVGYTKDDKIKELEARNTQLINLIERVLPYLETNKGDCLLDNSITIEAKKLLGKG